MIKSNKIYTFLQFNFKDFWEDLSYNSYNHNLNHAELSQIVRLTQAESGNLLNKTKQLELIFIFEDKRCKKLILEDTDYLMFIIPMSFLAVINKESYLHYLNLKHLETSDVVSRIKDGLFINNPL